MSEEEKAVLRKAAAAEGYLELSAWVRRTLLREAAKALKKSASQ